VSGDFSFDWGLLLDLEQDRLRFLDEVYSFYSAYGPVVVKLSVIADRLDLDRLAAIKIAHWLQGHGYIERSIGDELTITALGIEAVGRTRKERQDKTASSAKSSEQSIGLMEPDLRKHILALLELGIKHSDHGGLNQTRLSELENRLGLSRDVMRAAIKYLGERGLARLILLTTVAVKRRRT
jgi:hypothetical protein